MFEPTRIYVNSEKLAMGVQTISDSYYTYSYLDRVLHSGDDLPAVISNGDDIGVSTKEWYEYGQVHRKKGPAIIRINLYENEKIECWYYRGKLHQKKGKPAVVVSDIQTGNIKAEYWYQNGMLHRGNDLPAIVRSNGWLEWYINGHRHRDGDNPAFIRPDIAIMWYRNGKLHRENDLPAVITLDKSRTYSGRYGMLEWYINGKRHRNNDKPAIIFGENVESGKKGVYVYYLYDQLHRANDKPAVEDHDELIYAWYENGQEYRAGGKHNFETYYERKWFSNGKVVKTELTGRKGNYSGILHAPIHL